MKIQLSSSLSSNLRAIAHREIAQSCDDSINDIRSKGVSPSQHEVVFVAHLCKAMSDLAKSWNVEMTLAKTGLGLHMATVFTHQRPYVKWNPGNKRCELADVLIAVIDRRSSTPQGTAVLMQAKLSGSKHLPIVLSTPSEKTQFELLSTRPIFDVDKTPSPKGVDLSKFSPDSALMYGLTPFANHWFYPCWLTADDLKLSAGTYSVTANTHLADILVGMLLGNFGWQFSLPPHGKDWTHFDTITPRDEWSVLINYLLEETFKSPVTAKQSSPIGRQIRGQEDVICFAKTNSAEQQMFFMSYGMNKSIIDLYSSNESTSDGKDWQSIDPKNVLSQDPPNGDNSLGSDGEPASGPISAIVFEIGENG